MKGITFSLLILFCQPSSSQTCILARVTKNRINVFADSRIITSTYLSASKIYFRIPETFQKTGGANNIYFAVAGDDIKESYQNALSACNGVGTIIEISESYKEIETGLLSALMRIVRIRDENDFQVTYLNQVCAEAIFFGFENDTAKIVRVTFTVLNDIRQIYYNGTFFFAPFVSCNIQDYYITKGKISKIIPIGHIEGIKDSVEIESIWTKDPLKTGERLLRRQIDSTPEIVGLPIHVVELRRNKKMKEWDIN